MTEPPFIVDEGFDPDHDSRYVEWSDGSISYLDHPSTDDPDEVFVVSSPLPVPTTPPPGPGHDQPHARPSEVFAEPKSKATVTATKAQIEAVLKLAGLTNVRGLLNRPDPEWFIEGLIPDADLTVLHGAGGSKKSFVALDWALSSAHLGEWHGRRIRKGKWLYIVGEGVTGYPQRLRAWAKHHGLDPNTLDLAFFEQPFNLFNISEENIEALRAVIASLNRDYIVFDTLHKVMPGGDENSSKDVGVVFRNANRIAGDARVIFLHHKTKEGSSLRGSSSIRDDADIVISLDAVKNLPNNGIVSTMSSDKLRDAPEFEALAVGFKEIENDNESVSLVVEAVGSAAQPSDNRLRIINICKAEPFTHTKNAICCMLGDSGAVQKAFKSLVDDGTLVSEVRSNPNKRGPKMVDVWAVDENEENLAEGIDLS